MGRLLVLGLLLVMMLGLRALSGAGGGAHDPLILAAIGFVVMASFTAAELGSMLTLPRVSGYLAAGLALGPSLGNILSSAVVEDMTMFNTLALGLIATSAGLELDIKALKQLWKTLAATVCAKIVLSGGAVAGGFLLIESLWSPLGLTTMSQRAAVALVLGALSVGTSPAIALAVINETRARGRLADLTLGAAVIKDLVLVVLLAVSIAVASGLLEIGSGEGSMVATLATELLGSVVVGALLGGLIIGYVRFVRAEMLLFVAGLVLAASELSRALHLDLLLVFIAAGFVVRNFSREWEAVLHAIETVALPVFVVFFTIAGARIDVQATLSLLPLALTLAALRAGAFYASARLGARIGNEGPEVRRWAWLAYLPQAGVTLGLLGLAVEALTPVGKALADIGVACVAVNLAIGPVTMRRALQAGGARPDRPDPLAPSVPAPLSLMPQQSVRPPPRLETGQPELDRALSALNDELEELTCAMVRDVIRPHVQLCTTELGVLLGDDEGEGLVQRTHAWAREGRAAALAERASEAALMLRERALGTLDNVSPRLTVPFAPELAAAAERDTFTLRARKLGTRIRHRIRSSKPTRAIPLRIAARSALAARQVALGERLVGALCATHSRLLTELERAVEGQLDQEQVADAISAHLEHLESSFRSDATAARDAGLHELLEVTRTIDSPARPLASLRYSEVEPEVRARSAHIEASAASWSAALTCAEQRLVRVTSLARLRTGGEAALDAQVLLPLADAAEALEPVVAQTRRSLEEALERVRSDKGPELCAGLASDLSAATARREHQAGARADLFRAAPALLSITRELRSLVDALPEELRVVTGARRLHEYAEPGAAPLRTVRLHAEAQRELIQDFIPVLDLETRRASAAVRDLDARLGELLAVGLSAAHAAVDDPALGIGTVETALELAHSGLFEARDQAHRQLISAHDAIAAAFQQAFDELSETGSAPLDVRAAGLALARPLSRFMERAGRRLRATAHRLEQVWTALQGTGLGQRLSNRMASPRDLRALLSRDVAMAVPASYGRLFRLEAEQDLRLCIGRQAEIAVIVEGQARWRNGLSSSVLITGEPGSGRTTLMNVVQPEITAQRMLRPESVRSRRQQGLTSALAYELGHEGPRRELASALREVPTAVLVDDLEHWFTPDAGGLSRLRAFLGLVRSTAQDVFWIVCITDQALELLDDVVSVDDVFGDVVRLEPFTGPELQRAIEVRHSLSGLGLVYPSVPGAVLDRLLGNRRGELFFRMLHASSRGNLSTALSLWRNCIHVDNKRVTVSFEQLLAQHLPGLGMFDVRALSLLVQLLRFGPLTSTRLADSLGASQADVRGTLERLRGLGIVQPAPGKEYRLAIEWRGLLAQRLPGRGERR